MISSSRNVSLLKWAFAAVVEKIERMVGTQRAELKVHRAMPGNGVVFGVLKMRQCAFFSNLSIPGGVVPAHHAPDLSKEDVTGG